MLLPRAVVLRGPDSVRPAAATARRAGHAQTAAAQVARSATRPAAPLLLAAQLWQAAVRRRSVRPSLPIAGPLWVRRGQCGAPSGAPLVFVLKSSIEPCTLPCPEVWGSTIGGSGEEGTATGGRRFPRLWAFAVLAVLAFVPASGAAGTPSLVKDIRPGPTGAEIAGLTDVNGTIFFQADGGPDRSRALENQRHGRGHDARQGHQPVRRLAARRAPEPERDAALLRHRRCERQRALAQRRHGSRDDAREGVRPGASESTPGEPVKFSGKAYFSATDGTSGNELWRSDGTGAGTTLVKDINPGGGGSSPSSLTPAGAKLFFVAGDGAHGGELWQTDGTGPGTSLVKDIWPGASSGCCGTMTSLGSIVVFFANDGVNGNQLWKSDGTGPGTTLVSTVKPPPGSSLPSSMTQLNGSLYFEADDGSTGAELWKTDGTTAGTVLVKNINPGSGSSSPSNIVAVGSRLFFVADDGVNGPELWQSDGTGPGTTLVKNIAPGAPGSAGSNLTGHGTQLYLSADDGTHGQELWTSDGTAPGTQLVADLNASGSSSPHDLIDLNGSSPLRCGRRDRRRRAAQAEPVRLRLQQDRSHGLDRDDRRSGHDRQVGRQLQRHRRRNRRPDVRRRHGQQRRHGRGRGHRRERVADHRPDRGAVCARVDPRGHFLGDRVCRRPRRRHRLAHGPGWSRGREDHARDDRREPQRRLGCRPHVRRASRAGR